MYGLRKVTVSILLNLSCRHLYKNNTGTFIILDRCADSVRTKHGFSKQSQPFSTIYWVKAVAPCVKFFFSTTPFFPLLLFFFCLFAMITFLHRNSYFDRREITDDGKRCGGTEQPPRILMDSDVLNITYCNRSLLTQSNLSRHVQTCNAYECKTYNFLFLL